MLTFEQKLAVLDSYPQLERRDVSLGRVNYHFEGSRHEKKTVAYHLHPNGNGYVYAGLLDGYETDAKGMVNIRDFTEDALRTLLDAALEALSAEPPEPEAPAPSKKRSRKEDALWINEEGALLTLKREDDLWYVYSGLSLEMVFETKDEALAYFDEEGFVRKSE
ncbi:hypothetical protein ACE6ED_19690 [Paenibacillus sp. CN-4]|uniref:hypothetical protein n=1 Tax=Paenibacillus nanchangensis TaxID=3348343 RepID=UPI00397B9557